MSRLKQSVSWWCLTAAGLEPREFLPAVAEMGYSAVDLVEPEYWPLVKEYGLTIASTNGGMSIERGFNRREHHAELEARVRVLIEQAAQWHIPNLVVFSGNRAGLNDREGAEITAEGLARVAKIAADAGVTLVMELLNSKVDHPDYQCDHTDWGVEVCRMVNSPGVKLLYDIYHMQIMEGDIIRTIREYSPWIGHYHTAGNPGRHELNDQQEINYPPIVRAILATGYTGYLAHEFLPQGDALAGLKQAFDLCNLSL